MQLADDWSRVLHAEAASYAQVALANIRREFPSRVCHTMSAPGDFPYRPRLRTPVFYGSFDWHSCVQMHWVLIRLLRVAPDAVPANEIRAAVGTRFERMALAVEEEFIASPDGLTQGPYGWGWALTLIQETASWDDPYGRKWAAVLEELGSKIAALFLDWLPGAAYPVRHGMHANSAFGLSRALPYAAARAGSGNPALLDAITGQAHAWFGEDMLYPAQLEPSGGDFLSPALTEAELMARVLPPCEFAEWLSMFLPGIERGRPRCSPRWCRIRATAISRACRRSARAGPGAGGGWPRRCPTAMPASAPPSGRLVPTRRSPCRMSWATTTRSSTGSPPMPCSC